MKNAQHRIKQLEKCLTDVRRLLFERAVDINAAGRDTRDNPEFHLIQKINNRIERTLPS